MILLCLQYLLWSVGVYGFVMWLPSIIEAAPNMNMVATGWLSAVPYLLAVIGMLSASYFSDKTGNRKVFIWPFLLVAAVCLYAGVWIGTGAVLAGLCTARDSGRSTIHPLWPLLCSHCRYIAQKRDWRGDRADQQSGRIGLFAGSYLVGYLNSETGNFNASYTLMAVALVLATIITMLVIPAPAISYKVPEEV